MAREDVAAELKGSKNADAEAEADAKLPKSRPKPDEGFTVTGMEEEGKASMLFPSCFKKEPGENEQWDQGRSMDQWLGDRDITGKPKVWGVDPIADAAGGVLGLNALRVRTTGRREVVLLGMVGRVRAEDGSGG
jgi:hypothetical protein